MKNAKIRTQPAPYPRPANSSPAARQFGSIFLYQVISAARMVEIFLTKDPKFDAVPEMQLIMIGPLRQYIDARGFSDMIEDGVIPGYSEIVHALYAMLSEFRLDLGEQRIVRTVLERCSNHDFSRFVRLTSRKTHKVNPNGWNWAVSQLMAIAKGDKTSLGGYGARWQKGAKRRLQQLGIPQLLRLKTPKP